MHVYSRGVQCTRRKHQLFEQLLPKADTFAGRLVTRPRSVVNRMRRSIARLSSHSSTWRWHRPKISAALNPAGPPPTTSTSMCPRCREELETILIRMKRFVEIREDGPSTGRATVIPRRSEFISQSCSAVNSRSKIGITGDSIHEQVGGQTFGDLITDTCAVFSPCDVLQFARRERANT